MRLGILSDIHANQEALLAAYEHLSRLGCDKIICLGDVVGYGASPNECIDFLRERNIGTVRGNHDHYVIEPEKINTRHIQPYALDVIRWTAGILSEENQAWLKELPLTFEMDKITVLHASLERLDKETWPYILDLKSATFHFLNQKTHFALCGHSHIPLLFTFSKISHRAHIRMLKNCTLDLSGQFLYLINPGAVGQPRDADFRASVAVFDTERGTIALHRVDYDVQSAQQKIIDAKLPHVLAERLLRGR